MLHAFTRLSIDSTAEVVILSGWSSQGGVALIAGFVMA